MFEKFLIHLNALVEQDAAVVLDAYATNKLKVVYDQIDFIKSDVAKFYEIHQQALRQIEQYDQLSQDKTQKERFFALTKEAIDTIRVKNALRWYANGCEFFTEKTSWWNECLAQLPKQASSSAAVKNAINKNETVAAIEALQAMWQQQGRYAVFSTPDLISVYWRNIGVIEQWLKTAQQEFKSEKKYLAKNQRKTYQVHLKNLATILQQEKTTIRASLLTRLSVGIRRSDLRFDDVLVATAETLKQLGDTTSVPLSSMSPAMHHARRHMTSSILRYIQQIISIDGTQAEKAQLTQTLYAQSSHFILRTNPVGITFAIPKTVENIVAIKPPFYTKLPKVLQFLFRGEKAVYEFLQHPDCQYLLIAQQHFSQLQFEAELCVGNLRHSNSWNYCQELMRLLANEGKRQQVKQADFSPIFYPDVQRLLQGYKDTLARFTHLLFNKQLEAFDLLLTNLETQIQTRVLTNKEQLNVEDVRGQLSEFQKTWCIPVTDEWSALWARCQKVIVESDHTVFATVSTSGNTYAKATMVLNERIAKNDLLSSFKKELTKTGLELTAPELVHYFQNIQQQLKKIATEQPAFVKSTEIQTVFYRYVYNLLDTLQNLPGRHAFTPLEGHVAFILKTLGQLPIDETLRHEVTQLQAEIKNFKAFDWDLFLQIAITPRLRVLLSILTTDVSISLPKTTSKSVVNTKVASVESVEAIEIVETANMLIPSMCSI